MASADWAAISGGGSGAEVAQNVTMAFWADATSKIDAPFTYGFRSLTAHTKTTGLRCAVATHSPFVTGKLGWIRAVIRKNYTVDPAYSPFIGFAVYAAGVVAQASNGYFLGLSEDAAPYLVMRRGLVSDGIILTNDYFRKSTSALANQTWYDIKLECVFNPQGDVVCTPYLNTSVLATPSWDPILGMDEYIDDSLGIWSGDLPVSTTYSPVFGMHVTDMAGGCALFDYIQIGEQTTP